MADYNIRNDDAIEGEDRMGGGQPAPPEQIPKTLVLDHTHLMSGVDPWQCACRHLIKEAFEEVKRYERAILEHPDNEGKILRRVIKEKGFSCDPYYVDDKGKRITVCPPPAMIP